MKKREFVNEDIVIFCNAGGRLDQYTKNPIECGNPILFGGPPEQDESIEENLDHKKPRNFKVIFNHCPPVELLELSTESIHGKRHYVTPGGKYPSITSVLGAFPNPALVEWRKRVGEAEADRISAFASSRGTKFHSLCEQYLLNEEIDKKKFMPDILSSFYEFKSILHRINDIHRLEVPLYSNKLKVAGRVDAIGNFDGELSIIDFKTSKKEKREEWIESYFLQTTFYSMAYFELTGIIVKNIVILISVDDGDNQVFIKPVKDYVKPLISKINEYYRLYHV